MLAQWPTVPPLPQVHSSEVTPSSLALATQLLTAYTGGLQGLGPPVFSNVTDMFTDSFFW